MRWAQEGLEVAESELEKLGFAERTRCHQSVFLQERYRVCGAGLLEDLPVAIALSPWSRAPQPRSFEAVLRAGPPWPATPRKLKIDHGAVDGPAAFAARDHGCAVLNQSLQEGEVASVPKVLSASADALCELLQKGCDVCDLVADGLGACRDSERWCQLNHFREAPPLSAEGRVQVLACGLQAKLNGCGVDDWSYQRGHLVNGYEKVPNSSIPLQTLADKAAALGDIGSKLLTHLLGTASSEEKAASFRSDLAEAIWKVPGKLGASFLSTLAASHDDMPRTLLIALVRLGQGDKVPLDISTAAGAFAGIKKVKFHLITAARLSDVVAALQLARNMSEVILDCNSCQNKGALKQDWARLRPHLFRLQSLCIYGFRVSGLELSAQEDTPTTLKEIVLSENEFVNLPDATFRGLKSLQRLDLARNDLTTVPEGLLQKLPSLQSLSLEMNELTALPEGLFKGSSLLQTFDVSYNQLTLLPAKLFRGLTSLKELRIQKNKLSALPEGAFHGLASLEKLLLTGNLLSTVPKHLFQGLASLQTLSLINNHLTELPECLFQGTASLQSLLLSSNRLSILPKGLFQGLGSLKDLQLSVNRFSALPEGVLQGLVSLEELDLASNQFSAVPEGLFQGLSSLQKLELNDNNLTALPESIFKGLVSLQKLLLIRTRLGTLPGGLFHGLGSLEELHLSHNELSTIPKGLFEGVASLKVLKLDSNKLDALPEDLFHGLASLRTLMLQHNELSTLPKGLFRGLSSLQELDLSWNQLWELTKEDFQSLVSLTNLAIAGNRLEAKSSKELHTFLKIPDP